MPKALPEKCRLCAKLPALEAKQLHGVEGDACWDSRVCPNRRSYARHRDRRNQQRNQKRWAQQGRVAVVLTDQALDEETIAQIKAHPGVKQLQFETQLPDVGYSAVLQVYRRAVDVPLVAISGEVWRGGQKEADIAPISCATLTPRQVEVYVERLLKKLTELYGIRKFAALEELAPQSCPLQSR
ncbi:MAG: hypothetical protein HC780_21170 [Leptolyngbyaceae cyanobacterium CSU_1_3]|nr:hypothetical protein [Leptolyngbyaceae cyanobacterium CSU_1_3]